jgi:hypothetical protein
MILHRTIYYLGYPLGRFPGLKHRQRPYHTDLLELAPALTDPEVPSLRRCELGHQLAVVRTTSPGSGGDAVRPAGLGTVAEAP